MLDVLLGLVVEGVKDLFHSEVGHNMMHAAVHNVYHAVNLQVTVGKINR